MSRGLHRVIHFVHSRTLIQESNLARMRWLQQTSFENVIEVSSPTDSQRTAAVSVNIDLALLQGPSEGLPSPKSARTDVVSDKKYIEVFRFVSCCLPSAVSGGKGR